MLRFKPGEKYVLIEDSKSDGRVTHPANTPEEFAAACLAVVQYRHGAGYYGTWPAPKKPGGLPTRAEAEAMDDPDRKARALRAIKRYEDEVRETNAHNDTVARANKIVEDEDAKLIPRVLKPGTPDEKLIGYETNASRVLDQRREYEYEGIELEAIRVP